MKWFYGVAAALIIVGLALSGCAFSKCRDDAGGFVSCRRAPLVRDCGATVGDHFSAKDYRWVQPCDRKDDTTGCSDVCRPATDACEADYAAYHSERAYDRGSQTDAGATAYLEGINALMERDCPR